MATHSPRRTTRDVVPGMEFGPYLVMEEIGEGAMATVYSAVHQRLEKFVAIKVLRTDDDDARDALFQEAKLTARVQHENIPEIYDVVEQGPPWYFVMELLSGCGLDERLSRGPLPPRDALDIAVQIARGLSAAHEVGIVHRDLKPENIFLADRRDHQQVKLVDFGIAAKTKRGDAVFDLTPGIEDAANTIVGTPDYLSPEQIARLELDGRADIYAFGLLFFEMLTGRKAIHDDDPLKALHKHIGEDPPRVSDILKDVPPALDDLIFQCAAKSRDARPASATAILNALAEMDLGDWMRDPTAPAAVAVPHLVSGHGAVPLSGDTLAIGTDPGGALCFDEAHIAHPLATLTAGASHYALHPAPGASITLNDAPVTGLVRLTPGAQLTFGDIKALFVLMLPLPKR